MKRVARTPVVVAAGQLQSRLMNEADATLEAMAALIEEAASQRADLLVLPECAYPAYLLGSIESYRSGSHLSSSQFVDWLSERAVRHRLHIVSGYVEDSGERLFNSAVLIGPEGQIIGQARKRFLWHADHDWFGPGSEIPVFDTPLGRIGIIICAEARVPEIIASLANQGAELIAMPTCWINASRQPGCYSNPQPDYLIAARAREFGIPFVCADKCGLELTTGYVGQSCVALADGTVPIKAPAAGEALVISTLVPRPPAPSWISALRRARLLETETTVLPARTTPAPVTIALVSTAQFHAQFTGGMGETLFAPLQQQGVQVVVANVPQEAAAEHLAMLANAFDMRALAFPSRTDVFDLGPVRVGAMAGQALHTFAAGRALALQGAELLVYFDTAGNLSMLRTRALENRVFVAGVDADSVVLIGPDGEVISSATAEAACVATVDFMAASDKTVAPRTDIFAHRRPQMYRL